MLYCSWGIYGTAGLYETLGHFFNLAPITGKPGNIAISPTLAIVVGVRPHQLFE